MLRRVVVALAALIGLAPSLGLAQDWPQKPIRAVVPFAPGGPSDNIARAAADALSQATGQQWVIDNKGGAGGAIGTEAAVRAAPDGYTFYIGPAGSMTIIPHLRRTPYGRDDLIPIASTGIYIAGVTVVNELPVKTMAELVAYAKSKPGQLSFGSAGVGAVSHIRIEVLKLSAGVDINHVPYRGSAEALNDLLAGHVQIMFDNTTFPHVKAGKLRLLAMISDKRHPDFPDVPTVAEAGFPQVNVPLWYGVFAPVGTPQAIMDRVHAEVTKAMQKPELTARMIALGFFPEVKTQAELKQAILDEDPVYAKIIKDAKITNE